MTSAQTPTRKFEGRTSLQTPRTALVLAGVVLCFGLLSFFGYLVQSQLERGETFREAQRAGLYVVRVGGLLSPDRAPGAENGALAANASPR